MRNHLRNSFSLFLLAVLDVEIIENLDKRKEKIKGENVKSCCLRNTHNGHGYGGKRPYLPPYCAPSRPLDKTDLKSKGPELILEGRPSKT